MQLNKANIFAQNLRNTCFRVQFSRYFANSHLRGAASQAYDGNTIYELTLFLPNDIQTYVFRPPLLSKVDPDFNKSKAHVCTWTFQVTVDKKKLSRIQKNSSIQNL